MTDFWIAVIFTSVVSLLTVLADWLVSRLIFSSKTLRSMQEIHGSGLSQQEAIQRFIQEIERYQESQSKSLIWGSDLATVALSLDFATLGIWIHNSSFFPFFSRFNSPNISREIPIWLIVIGAHLVLLILSLVMKHKYGATLGAATPLRWANFPTKLWFAQNGWMLAANVTGFVSLLSCFVVITNAV